MKVFYALLALLGVVMLMDVCQAVEPVNIMVVDSDDQPDVCSEKNWCEATGFMDDLNYKCWVTSFRLCAGVRRVGDKSICRHSESGDVVKCQSGTWNVRPKATYVPEKRFKRLFRRRRTSYVVQYVPDHPPSIHCPPEVRQRASSGQKTAAVSWSPATASDDRGVPSVTQSSGPPSGSLFNEGQTVIGYRATDSAGQTAQCQFAVTISVTRCPSPPNFSHGTRSCTGAEGNVYGSTCSHSCDTGYVLQGASSTTCQDTGAWSSSFPSCQPVSCGDPGNVAGGVVVCPRGHVYPESCVIQCNAGFVHSGVTTISCLSGGTWTGKDSCTDVTPPLFTNGCPPSLNLFSGPLRALVAITWVDPVVTDNGGQLVTLTSVPAKGSTSGPGSYTVDITATDVVGNAASCQIAVTITARECPKLANPSDGNVSCTMDHVEGSVCTVSCNHGYRLQGQAALTCLNTEQWDVAPPTCQAVVCAQPPSFRHGQFSCPNGRQCPAVCNLTCAAGFKVRDPKDIQCQQDGTWTQAGSCQDIKAPVFTNGCPSDMNVYAARLGLQTIVNWSAPVVSDNSGDAVNVTSDVKSGSVFPVGTTAVTHEATDVNGNTNSCQSNVTVTVLKCGAQDLQPAPANGSSPLQEACPDGYVHGAACTLSCAQGYRLQGRSAITCERDDSTHPPTLTWQWAGPLSVKPQCKEDLCPPLSPPDHGALSCWLGDHGWHCYMFCDSDWDVPTSFDGRLVCYNQERIWRPSPAPHCVARMLPHRVRMMGNLLYFTGSCNVSTDQLRQKYMTIINQSIYGSACASITSCVAENVEVTCSTALPRGKRHAGTDDRLMARLRRGRRHAGNVPTSHYVYVTFHVTLPYAEDGDTPEKTYQNFKTKATNLVIDLKSRVLTGQLNVEGLVADDSTVGSPKLGADCPPGTVYRFTRPKTRFSCVSVSTQL